MNPRIGARVYHDIGGFEGYRTEVTFLLDRGIQNVAPWGFRDVGGWMVASGSWSDCRQPARSESEDYAWRAGVGLALDRGLWAMSLGVAAQDPRDAGVGVDARLAFRLWPNAAPLGRGSVSP